MANFLADDIHQSVFLDINFLEVLGENTFEYSLYCLMNRKNILEAFDSRYKNSNRGRKAYPPELLLRVIFYAYYRGVTSSRTIADLCKTDLKFMALASGRTPHFTTIADFISGHPEAITDVFHKVLLVCDQSGLVGKKHFAIDGCKLPSDASRQWSGTHKELQKKSDKMKLAAQKIVDKHKSNDGKPGDESIKARELQSVETLMKNADKIDTFLNDNEPRMGKGKRPKEVKSNITDPDSANMLTSKGAQQGFACVTTADEKNQIIVQAEAYGQGQEQTTLIPTIEAIHKALPDTKGNDDLVITADTGFSSEANMQYIFENKINAVIPDGQFRKRNSLFVESEKYQQEKDKRKKTRKDKAKSNNIPNTEFIVDMVNETCICPAGKEMLSRGIHEKKGQGLYMRFQGGLNDCRNCPMVDKCMRKSPKDNGRQVSFKVESEDHLSFIDKMKAIIDSERGRYLYSKRMHTIEPVFGNITHNRGLKRLTLRGKAKVNAQWLMYSTVHNLEKLWRYGGEAA